MLGGPGALPGHASATALEFCVLLNPLLYWLDYAIEKPISAENTSHLEFFQNVWKAVSRVTERLPSEFEISLTNFALPILQKVQKHCEVNSPRLPMLKAVITILNSDIKLDKRGDLQEFLNGFLLVFARNVIPHSLYDEVFVVFERMLQLSRDFLSPAHIEAAICALIDKYTMRSKMYKLLTKTFL